MIVFHSIRICNVVSPIIVLLHTQVKVDTEQPPVKQIWPEMMGIILAVNLCMVPFLKTFGVEKVNCLYLFALSIDSSHALSELVKEYVKRPTPDRWGCITGTVDEDYKEMEEVDYYGPSVGNGV